MMRRFSIGLIINPYAGIGGALALKGSDGKEVREKALKAGAEKTALKRSELSLQSLLDLREKILFYTCDGDMGASLCDKMGFKYEVVYHRSHEQSEAEDTIAAAKAIANIGVDLLLFAGGDGTARNLCDIFSPSQAMLGIPAGCKIHSGVYAVTPNAAGIVAKQVVNGELLSIMQADVKDIDEDAFRGGQVIAKYYGEMSVPESLHYIQSVKAGGKESNELVLADIAATVQELIDEHAEHYIVVGSGSTIDFIMEDMGLDNTLLGVDIMHKGQIVAKDVTAYALETLIADKPCKLLITAIGGQGHIFGRGNQQLSPTFLAKLSKDDMWVVSTKSKLLGLKQNGFVADTGDTKLDAKLAGPIQVITGYKDKVLYFVRSE
ncbi:ATP-NAD kinase family protein [Agaribacter flavus]|uniref:ATP-NAD kinase family protein n=1 Tax=Agaribacter flavus TaxID=1902781 RepID=A0ABV7FN16_9ALTE